MPRNDRPHRARRYRGHAGNVRADAVQYGQYVDSDCGERVREGIVSRYFVLFIFIADEWYLYGHSKRPSGLWRELARMDSYAKYVLARPIAIFYLPNLACFEDADPESLMDYLKHGGKMDLQYSRDTSPDLLHKFSGAWWK